MQSNKYVAFISHNKTLYMTAFPAINTSANFAKKAGTNHGIIISTTPSNIDSPSGKFCKGIIDNGAQFVEGMYDWSKKKITKYISKQHNGFLSIKYTWRQLGLTEKWYNEQVKGMHHEWLKIKREVDLEWTKSSESSVFSEEQLDTLSEYTIRNTTKKEIQISKVSPKTLKEKILSYYLTLVGKEINIDNHYFIGIDTSGGKGKDHSAIVILDPKDEYREVAVFSDNKINTKNFSLLIAKIVRLVTPNCTLFIENNSYGQAVIDNLLEDPFVFKKIYYEDIKSGKTGKYLENKKKNSKKGKKSGNVTSYTNRKFGINTNISTRNLMMDILKEAVIETPEIFISEDVVYDISGLEYSKEGKIEHSSDTHDDRIMSKLFVLYAVRYGTNIAKFLRSADSIERTKKRLSAVAAVSNNGYVVEEDNKSTVDFQEIMTQVSNGGNLEEILARARDTSDHTKVKPDAMKLAALRNFQLYNR